MAKPKVLFWDIETSLQPVAVFQLSHNDWIDPSAILQERYIICASWQWEGEDRVSSVSVLDDRKRYAKNPHDDYVVVKKLHEVLSEADVLVHHNGDSFDLKYAATRMLIHGFPTLPPIQTIDTCKIARSRLMFNSNKLDYIGRVLGVGKKLKTTPKLWLKILNGDSKAVRDMIVYNKQDVTLLRRVFEKLQPYVPTHINRELFGQVGCPRCGSNKIQSRGVHRIVAKTYRRWQCQACFGWFRTTKADQGSTKFRVL